MESYAHVADVQNDRGRHDQYDGSRRWDTIHERLTDKE